MIVQVEIPYLRCYFRLAQKYSEMFQIFVSLFSKLVCACTVETYSLKVISTKSLMCPCFNCSLSHEVIRENSLLQRHAGSQDVSDLGAFLMTHLWVRGARNLKEHRREETWHMHVGQVVEMGSEA